MFSTELGFTLEAAFREASTRQHAYFTVEHLLYALLFEPSVRQALEALDVESESIRHSLEEYFDEEMEQLNEGASEPIQTPSIRRVLERSVVKIRSSGRTVVTPQDVFIALVDEEETHAAFFLAEQGLNKVDLLEYVSHGRVPEFPQGDAGMLGDEGHPTAAAGTSLNQFTENLTEEARSGKLDPVIGRKPEIDRALRVLSRRQKNNPLLVGEAGVGKTAVANAIAQLLVGEESLPASLKAMPMYSLNIGSLIAGTKFRGDLEERFKKLLSELKEMGNVILLIDEIHTILGSGNTNGSSLDAASLLKPALSEGWLRCIGISTHEDYKKNFRRDKGFARRFSVIEIDEPSVEETVRILEGLKVPYEKHHQVTFTHAALRAAAELSAKYINDRSLPDKAIDVIDETGARNALLTKQKRKKSLSVREIEEVVSLIAKVPVARQAKNDSDLIRGLGDRISANVFGQPQAVDSVVRAIKRGRAHLKSPNLPVGCFLFAGPTGVGKTELAKTLARELSIHFHRLDMSEFMEKHSVSRLLGAPPGYVGHEEGGFLVDQVRKNPNAVLLFDEIEKAHSDVFNILLQIMDDAVVTDTQGRQADFRHIVIILTTNAGSDKSGSIGFGEGAMTTVKEDEIKKLFRPEFRNRLDEIVYFKPLPQIVIENVAKKFIKELQDQLRMQGVTLTFDTAALNHISMRGFDSMLGARPMRRFIQREIKDKIIDELLFGSLIKGGEIEITLNGDKLDFRFSPKQIVVSK
jgi:ATP-dependent Clp protease ATP-binding subunit ClpA